LIVGLTGFGIGGFTSGSQRNVGEVGDTKIGIDDYGRQLNRTVQNVSNQIGRNLTPVEISQSGIQQSVLSEMIAIAALDNETAQLGISVGDTVVRDELLATPGFQSLAGEFDTQAYQFTLERAGLNSSEYEATIRLDNARAILQGSVLSGLSSDQTASKTFVAFAGETRDFDWVELTADDLLKPIEKPSEEALVEYYELNPLAYTAPLTRDISYVWLSPESLTDQVEISLEEVKEAYEINSERYNRPARRVIDRIIFSSQTEAEEARSKLDALVTDFDAIAEGRGLTAADIDQGEKEKSQLPPAIGDLVFGSAEPGIVGPVDTDLGPALYRINAIFDESIIPFETAEPDLRTELAAERTNVLVLNILPEIDDLLAAGATLEELAADTDMVLSTLSFTAETTEGIAAYQEFRQAASLASDNDFPEVLNLSDGGVFALRLDGITQPKRIPLDEVRDQVTLDWTAAETVRALHTVAQGLSDKLSETSDLANLDVASVTAEGVARTGFIDGTPPVMVSEVFGVELSEIVIVDDVNSVFLAHVSGIQDMDLASDENQQTLVRISEQLDRQVAQDIQNAYTRALQDDAGVTINQPMIDAVNSQLFTGGGYGG
jgi:peptidyl-prolyl cis-trans isomerase D